MRKLMFVTTALLLGLYGWSEEYPDRAARAQAEADVRAALEVRCDRGEEPGARECERTLTERFAAGRTSPQAVLRMHCTKWQGPFVKVSEEPPQLCVDRFGGWLRS